MNRFSTPPVVAVLAFGLALVVSPDLGGGGRWPAAEGALVGLALLLVAALAGRAGTARFLALGALTVAIALGYDAVRGERGLVELSPGETTRTLREQGRGGQEIGLHPLGFDLSLRGARADGGVVLATPQVEGTVSSARAVTLGRYRIGDPRPTGTPLARLIVSVEDGSGREERGEVPFGRGAHIGGLDISLEQYFPDFALDERQRPYSRSAEPLNPAALLGVSRGDARWRVFVIRAMSGIHRPEGLDRVIRLEDVEPIAAFRLDVSREPASALAAAGALWVVGALTWRRR